MKILLKCVIEGVKNLKISNFYNNLILKKCNRTTLVYFYILLIHYMTGTVKFFNDSKGYGFITNDESGQDIFVHVTSLNGLELKEGDKVEYQEEDGKKGKVASQIQRL